MSWIGTFVVQESPWKHPIILLLNRKVFAALKRNRYGLRLLTDTEWTPEILSSLCSPECRDDLNSLSQDIEKSCSEEILDLQLGKRALGDYGGLLQYRADHLCLREDDALGDFCVLAKDKWVFYPNMRNEHLRLTSGHLDGMCRSLWPLTTPLGRTIPPNA